MMHSKTIRMNLLTIVHPFIVETITSVRKTKGFSGGIYFRQENFRETVTPSKPVIPPSQLSFFFFGKMLGSNRYSQRTVLSQVGNIADSCVWRNTNRKLKCTASINCISIINLINGGVCSLPGYLYQMRIYCRSNIERVIPKNSL